MAEAATAQADEIFRRLRVDILKGRWEPRSGLPFDELSACYGTSGGVLREVLPRLAGQSPAVFEPQPGFRVVPVSVQDLRHLTEARVAIETLALQQSVTWGAVGRELAPLAAHRTLSRMPPYGEDGLIDPEWLAAHARFPSVLGCPNTRLRAIADSSRDAVEVCWSRGPVEEQHRDVAGGHRLEAALARDVDGGVTASTDQSVTRLSAEASGERVADEPVVAAA
ncbi:GntR family transcriptional regulator [Carbonactinospora thermoautotrophica]|uniref:GntR family transcriptional regulator n=1 Tax=Carbonactinospora thermoautotrophica TaxID=1469144 RepID=UPI0022707A8F|nr:GntR family transcriptional regulator [Carbonactinospora thermoautotrophica]MCX9191927.1 GntR family transcriptional regulator [Carbonactinospora thermoautotrophica]